MNVYWFSNKQIPDSSINQKIVFWSLQTQQMAPSTILFLIIVYFGILFLISHFVSKKDSGNDAFFKANKIQNGI